MEICSCSATQAFQKGSPIARDFSKAILQLLENGELQQLADDSLTPSHECSTNITSTKPRSLSLQSFGVLYLISVSTSAICFLLSLIQSRSHQQNQEAREGNFTPDDEIVWKKVVKLVRNFRIIPGRAAAVTDTSESIWTKGLGLARCFHIKNSGRNPTMADTASTNEDTANVHDVFQIQESAVSQTAQQHSHATDLPAIFICTERAHTQNKI